MRWLRAHAVRASPCLASTALQLRAAVANVGGGKGGQRRRRGLARLLGRRCRALARRLLEGRPSSLRRRRAAAVLSPACGSSRGSSRSRAARTTWPRDVALCSPLNFPINRRIVRAFLIEEQKIVKKVLKSQAGGK